MRVMLNGEEIRLEPDEWRLWVEDGRIPPDTPVFDDTSAGWIPAANVPGYREAMPRRPAAEHSKGPNLWSVIAPAGSFSATEVLVALNLLVAAVLVVWLGDNYSLRIHAWATRGWYDVHANFALWRWIPTLFIHADSGHLFGNLTSLVAGCAALEFLTGRTRTLAVYLITGLTGAALSYLGHGGPPLSIGASGAVFGLAGAGLSFVIRRRTLFSYRQRWKSLRVYLPLYVIMYGASLFHADYYAHLGGLLGGLALGWLLPPHARLEALAQAADAHRDL